ncbi:MAG: energy-coupling factor ABC transporter ATP-binding protein [Alphaproteobacteria bacterium]|nr:energy-coupling factor ABC transporter ATP-binding protein [Alphaproteobacteria bacterium]
MQVAPGERVLVTGPSGSGKSSLALCWNGIVPQSIPARLTGSINLCGRSVGTSRVADLAACIAYVFQDADSQLCALTVEDEIAFALENRCLPRAEIEPRIDAALAALGLAPAMRRRLTRTLSGGEKQRVALAAALAQDVPVYVFDEPTAQLDPEATAATYRVINRLARDGAGRALIYVDHKVETLLPLTDRALLLGEDGTPRASGDVAHLFHDQADLVAATGAWLPTAASLFRHLRRGGLSLAGRPLTVADALRDLDAETARAGSGRQITAGVADWLAGRATAPTPVGPPILSLDRVGYAPAPGIDILSDLSISLHGGEIVGVVGRNGAGKSTLGLVLANLLRPTRGARLAHAAGAVGVGQFVFQNPEHQFVGESVQDEVRRSVVAGAGASAADVDLSVDAALRSFGLESRRETHPFQLSHGQKRRLSILVALLAPDRPVLVLDEPSYGLDERAAWHLRGEIAQQRRFDRAIVVISHDLDWLAGLCDRVAVLDRGRLVRFDRAAAVFADAPFLAGVGLAAPAAQAVADWLHARG